MDGFFGLYNHVDPPQVSFGWLNKKKRRKYLKRSEKIYLDCTVRSTESSQIWFVTNRLWFDSQMRRMYGLFTYMKGEKWPHSRGNGLVNIPYMEHLGLFCPDFQQTSRSHTSVHQALCAMDSLWEFAFVAGHGNSSAHFQEFPPIKKKKSTWTELALEMDDYFPSLNLDLFSWWCFWRIGSVPWDQWLFLVPVKGGR